MRMAAAAVLLGWCAVAQARRIPLYSSPGPPLTRALVTATVGGHPVTLFVDSGAAGLGPTLARGVARLLGLVSGEEVELGMDVENRPIRGERAAAPVAVDGWGAVADEVNVSDWLDEAVGLGWSSFGRQADGLIDPKWLAHNGESVVLDFPRSTIEELPWPEARARVHAAGWVLGEVALDGQANFLVPAKVSGEMVRLVVDTGAPRSMLFRPRSDDLPARAVRMRPRRARLTVGPMTTDVDLDVLEPLPGVMRRHDGLLGMDILQHCVLALDRSRMMVGCRSIGDTPTATIRVGSRPLVHASAGGPWLQPMVNGTYLWHGAGTEAVIARDGTVRLVSGPGGCDVIRRVKDDRSEAQWFLDETLDMRLELMELARREQIRASLDWLPHHLANVWADARWSVAERRRILFLLWDEAAEPDDPELAWAGARARTLINRFVRTHLPSGSDAGFSAGELEQLNATRAKGPRFDPYNAVERIDTGE